MLRPHQLPDPHRLLGGRPRKEIAAQELGPKTLVWGSEAQGGLDRGREGQAVWDWREGVWEGRRGGGGAGWQARVSAEGEMWLGELAEGRGVNG